MKKYKNKDPKIKAALLALTITMASGMPALPDLNLQRDLYKISAAETRVQTVEIQKGEAYLTVDKYADHAVITGASPAIKNTMPGGTEIEIPDSVTQVGASAFAGSALNELTIPDSVQFFDSSAISGCINLGKVTLSRKLYESITPQSEIEYVIKESKTKEDEQAVYTADMKTLLKFKSSNSVDKFVIPETVETIAAGAFSDFYRIPEVILPEGLKKIGAGAFRESGIREIVIPDSVTEIGEEAFSGCDEMISVIFNGKDTELGSNVFENCTNLVEIRLPEGLKKIPDGTFSYVRNIDTLTLPLSLETIENVPQNVKGLIIGKNTETDPDIISGLKNLQYIAGTTGSSAQRAAETADIKFISEYQRFSADSNRDGKINILDMIYLKNYIINDGEIDSIVLADTNLDGVVDARDVITLKNELMGNSEIKKGLRDIRIDKFSLESDLHEDEMRIDDEDDIDTSFYPFASMNPDECAEITEAIRNYVKDGFAVYFVSAKRYNNISNVMTIDPVQITSTSVDALVHRSKNPNILSRTGTDIFLAAVPKDMYSYQRLSASREEPVQAVIAKPVIYLYPEEESEINVKLSLSPDSKLAFSYPQYPGDEGWTVTASPDSVLHDENGREYSYLFWEANSNRKWDMSEGFVVKGSDTVAFLQEKLEYLGLTPKEYNEFIVYWMPLMQNNKYNLITFQTDDYEDMAKLDITPEPDSIQRVFMTFKALDEYKEIPQQQLEPFTRHGYTVIEWGGTEIK